MARDDRLVRHSLDTEDRREILANHWHPNGALGREASHPYPHIHLGQAAQIGLPALANAHIPSERVPLESVIRLAVDHFAVVPLRQDWQRILEDTQRQFEERRTWPRSGARSRAPAK